MKRDGIFDKHFVRLKRLHNLFRLGGALDACETGLVGFIQCFKRHEQLLALGLVLLGEVPYWKTCHDTHFLAKQLLFGCLIWLLHFGGEAEKLPLYHDGLFV